jgi:hypothetical protein
MGLSVFWSNTNNHHHDDANNGVDNNDTVPCVIFQPGDELLCVPQAIQFSAQKSLGRLQKIGINDDEDNLANQLARSVQHHFPESMLEQQDVVTAMELMVE